VQTKFYTMKKLLLILTIASSTFYAKSQEFYNAVGGTLFGIIYDLSSDNFSTSGSSIVPGVTYKGTLGFEINRSTNFGITVQPSLGLGGEFNSQSGASQDAYFGFQLPITGEVYFGDIDDKSFHIGAGIDYKYVNGLALFGPTVGLGGQFEVKDRLIGLRGFYTLGLNSESDVYTVRDSRNGLNLALYFVF
jgi:hypothetical protein